MYLSLIFRLLRGEGGPGIPVMSTEMDGSALSSVFQLFGGRPPSTEDVIKKGFEKQKKWMETKFGELDTKLTNLETSIVNMITSEALKQREEIRVKEMKQLCNKAGGIPVDSITASLFVWNWLS